MSQPRIHSLIESIANVAIGLGVAVATQVSVFPLFGIHIPLSDNLSIAGIFTVVSIVRSYAVRRLFNFIHVGKLVHEGPPSLPRVVRSPNPRVLGEMEG